MEGSKPRIALVAWWRFRALLRGISTTQPLLLGMFLEFIKF
jgi:hypothetical protein